MPGPLELLILILAAYRLTRLAGWDDFPLAYKIRSRVIGERWVSTADDSLLEQAAMMSVEEIRSPEGAARLEALVSDDPSLPGKQPPSEADAVRPAYDRPTLAHLVHCPFCIGFYLSCVVYVAWLAAGAPGELSSSWVWWVVTPLAISGSVGLIAKNLDA